MRLLILIGFLMITACSTLPRYDLQKLGANFTDSLKEIDDIVQKSKVDWQEKSNLMVGLRKMAPTGFTSAEPTLKRQLDAMQADLEKMNELRKSLNEANTQVVALAYTRQEIRGDDPAYASVATADQNFRDKEKEVRQTALNYSRTSHNFADEVTKRQLMLTFDVDSFQNRVHKSVQQAQATNTRMQMELDSAQKQLAATGSPELEDIFTQMSASAQAYTDQAQQLAPLAQKMTTAAMGGSRISNLDSAWPNCQKLMQELDRVLAEMSASQNQFQSDVERWRKPFKRAQ